MTLAGLETLRRSPEMTVVCQSPYEHKYWETPHKLDCVKQVSPSRRLVSIALLCTIRSVVFLYPAG